jgi:hypothetical protein
MCASACFVAAGSMASSSLSYVITERNFGRLAAAAISTGRTLHLGRRRVELHTPYRLGSNNKLRIEGGSIHGDGHSIFQVEGTRQGLLELMSVQLKHRPSTVRTEKRSQGAAIFVRGKGRLALHDCDVSSDAGFGLWLVQKTSAAVHNCTFRGGQRSSVVAFERSSVELHKCKFVDSSPHAICARGDAAVAVRDSTIIGAALRAIYCYHSARLDVRNCRITGTRSDAAAAIQIDALRPGDAASLSLMSTTFEYNAGGDLSVSGNVERSVESCVYDERRATDFGAFSARERDAGYLSEWHGRPTSETKAQSYVDREDMSSYHLQDMQGMPREAKSRSPYDFGEVKTQD